MRNEQRGEGELVQQFVQLHPHLRLRVCVERRERFVEQQHRRVARERPCERDPLTLAAGQFAGSNIREMRDSESLEQLVDAITPRVADVRANAQMREQRVVLEHESDTPLFGWAVDGFIQPDVIAERDAAPCPCEARDDVQCRRLARA